MFEKPLGLRENPFLAGHHPKYLFPSREHQEALAHLRYGIQNREPFVLITGEVGTGKTTAVYDAIAEWGSRALVALITNSALTRAELLEEICLRFGVAYTASMSKPAALVGLERQLSEVRGRGELAILLVDEAQNLDRELLEEIRLLSNLEVNGEYLLQIFLVGQPELEHKLAQKELRQLRQRIGIHYRILPLSGTETARYIHHRVSVAGGNSEELFPATTCVEIFRVTNGIPREINIVAGQSLLNAFVEDSRVVSVEHVQAVEREIEFQSVLRHQANAAARPAESAAPKKRGAETPAKKRPGRTKTSAAKAPATPAATIVPMAPAHAAAAVEAPRAESDLSTGDAPGRAIAEDEMDVEVSESAFGESARDTDDALVDEFAATREPNRADEEDEPPLETGTAPAPRTVVLPSWIDEIVARRQAMDERTAARPTAPPQAPPPPLTVVEPGSGLAYPGAPKPSREMFAAPPPDRPDPPPTEPLSLFDHAGDPTEHLPGRRRGRLGDGEERDRPRRSRMAWPIASVVIAAVAITVLLVVRFGPWSAQRRSAVPAGMPPLGASPDTGLLSQTPFPPFVEERGPGARPGTAASRGARRSVATVPPASGDAPAASGDLSPSTSPEPGSATLPDGATADPAGALVAGSGSAGDVAGTAARSALSEPPSFGIAVGTYLNEARANAERTRLGETTKLVSRVVTVAEDTVSMYRVVVGRFGDRISAERAASELVQRGLVAEARVVTVAQAAPTRP